MPAIANIDWPGIRANAVTLGIRPAARAAAANLPPDEAKRFEERVAKRATREGWEDKRLAAVASSPGPQRGPVMPMSTNVHNGQDAVLSHLARQRDLTTAAMSALALKTAVAARNVPLRVETPSDLLALANAHARIHRIEQTNTVPTLTLNLFSVAGQMEKPVLDV